MILNLTYKITRSDCVTVTDFFQNKEENHSEENIFQKQSTFTAPIYTDRDLDHQIHVLKNLDLEKMEEKPKSNLSNMGQKFFKIK